MKLNYKHLESKINKINNKIILSHYLDLDEIRYISNNSSESDSESESEIKYYPLDNEKKIKINYKNYDKLIMNNLILLQKILDLI